MPSDWKLASPSSISQPTVLLNRRRGTMGTTIWRSFCLVFKGWPWTSNLPASTSWMLGVFHMMKNKARCGGTCPKFLALGGWGWKVQAKLVWTTQKNKIYFLGERSHWAHRLPNSGSTLCSRFKNQAIFTLYCTWMLHFKSSVWTFWPRLQRAVQL